MNTVLLIHPVTLWGRNSSFHCEDEESEPQRGGKLAQHLLVARGRVGIVHVAELHGGALLHPPKHTISGTDAITGTPLRGRMEHQKVYLYFLDSRV